MNERDIFDNALAISDPRERAEYLDVACEEDRRLRKHIEGLLAVHDKLGGFLELPAVTTGASTKAQAVQCQIGSQIGPYKLREQIGEGGMGVVYVAEQTEPVRRKVALKIIKPGMDSQQVLARFESERQALAMMDHPHIARIIDAGTTETRRSFFVMELVHGAPINAFCDEHELTSKERLLVFAKVCKAVQHAHQKGIIHRDLKPSNVLVASIDGEAIPKVIDFGVAKAAGPKTVDATIYTQFSQIVGTPLYMSPEQAELGVADVDTRSDVYALGVILYELLTGSTPFDSETLKQAGFDEMRRIIREDEPPRPSVMVSTLEAEALSTVSQRRGSDPRMLSGSLRGELDWIVMTALEKDRRRRYASASALAEDVQRFLRDEPIAARPASRWYLAQKFVRRHRAVVASASVVVVALVTGLALAVSGLQIAKHRAEDLAIALEDQEALTEVLSDMYPKRYLRANLGRKRTVFDAIEEVSEELNNGRLNGHPRAEIKVRQVFADAYWSALEFAKFREHLHQALHLAEQEYGVDSLIVGKIHEKLSLEIGANGSELVGPEYVLRHANRAINIYERAGISSVGVWTSKGYALAHWPERHTEAIQAAEMAMQLDDGKAQTCMDLGNHYAYLEDEEHLGKALSYYTQALDIHEQQESPRPNVRANLLAHQALCLRRLGRMEDALAAFREAFDLFDSPELKAEPDCHAIGRSLAKIQFVMGNVGEAFELTDQIEEFVRSSNIASSLIISTATKGWLYFQLGDYDRAEDYFARAMHLAEDEYGRFHGWFGLPCLYLGLTYEAMGKSPEDTATIYRQLLPLTKQYTTASYVNNFAFWAHARGLIATDGDLDDATRIGNRALHNVRARRQIHREPALHVLRAKIHRSRNQFKSAITELRNGLNKAKEPSATYLSMHRFETPTDRRQVEDELVELLLESGRTDEALTVRIQAVEERKRAFPDPDHIQTILAEIRLGTLRSEQKRHGPGTVDAFADALTRLRKFSPWADGVRRKAIPLVVEAYEDLGDSVSADRWHVAWKQLNETSIGPNRPQPDISISPARASVTAVESE